MHYEDVIQAISKQVYMATAVFQRIK